MCLGLWSPTSPPAMTTSPPPSAGQWPPCTGPPSCAMSPAEHLALPNLDDVKQGIMASKIAAHAADIAKGVRGAREIDDKMGDARRALDWEGQWACALDPETARSIRADRAPEHDDSCSMCGKFCAVRSMNKALNGEHIDIL